MPRPLAVAIACVVALAAPLAAAQVTLYAWDGFRGPSYGINWDTPNLDPYGFNDRAQSVIVERGRWELCSDAYFSGRCTVLAPGQYPSLAAMGLANRVSSVRRVADPRAGGQPPAPPPAYGYYPRYGEELYQAEVTAVRAVGGPPEQRCWVEPRGYTDRNVAGAIVGGIIGGVLGHQIGGGRGKDVATAGGAVAGAAIGSNVGREGGTYGRDVQRCETAAPAGAPEIWDVTYVFRGREHRAQMSAPPGPTIWVNQNGEPRG
jgi:hypothetical protein